MKGHRTRRRACLTRVGTMQGPWRGPCRLKQLGSWVSQGLCRPNQRPAGRPAGGWCSSGAARKEQNPAAQHTALRNGQDGLRFAPAGGYVRVCGMAGEVAADNN
jgi:hypothetical protein